MYTLTSRPDDTSFISYDDPPMKLGWTTGVYILDETFHKLGGFGV